MKAIILIIYIASDKLMILKKDLLSIMFKHSDLLKDALTQAYLTGII